MMFVLILQDIAGCAENATEVQNHVHRYWRGIYRTREANKKFRRRTDPVSIACMPTKTFVQRMS
jgi:hypothetical protein